MIAASGTLYANLLRSIVQDWCGQQGISRYTIWFLFRQEQSYNQLNN
jgi:hypothetical protein